MVQLSGGPEESGHGPLAWATEMILCQAESLKGRGGWKEWWGPGPVSSAEPTTLTLPLASLSHSVPTVSPTGCYISFLRLL